MANLYLLTNRYPYTHQTEFVEDFVDYSAKIYGTVFVLTESLRKDVSFLLPKNVEVIRVRKKKIKATIFVKSFFMLFNIKTLSEIGFAFKHKYRNIIKVLKAIFINYYYRNCYLSIFKNRKINDDDVFISNWNDHKAYALSCLKRKKIIKRFFVRTHGYDCFFERSYLPFRRIIMREADGIYPVSKAGENSIKTIFSSYLDNSDKVRTCYLGIEKKYNKEIIYQLNDYCLVSCSNVVDVKRLDLIIDALEDIDNINITWIHFGNGVLLKDMTDYANRRLSKKKNIKFKFFGFKSNLFIQRFYSRVKVDAFINCSEYEGIPVSIMEACAYGIPVIARDVGGVSEIVSSKNGILLKYNINKDLLARAIITVLCDYKEDFSYNSTKMYENKFKSSKNVKKLIDLISGKI